MNYDHLRGGTGYVNCFILDIPNYWYLFASMVLSAMLSLALKKKIDL